MAEQDQKSEQAAAGATAVQFAIQRVYLKDLSFEAPNGLLAPSGGQPKVNQDLNTQVNRLADDVFEVVLNVTVAVKVDDEKTAFLVEVHQAGIFSIKGVEGGQLQHLLSTACPTILFPYARETIDNMASRGGFPPLSLPPINFDALYVKAMKDNANKAEETDSTH